MGEPMIAPLMREAADMFDADTQCCSERLNGPGHATSCIVTRLRMAADQMEKAQPCTTCHCYAKARAFAGDPIVGVHFPPACEHCGKPMTLHMWDRPGGPPGNGWICDCIAKQIAAVRKTEQEG